MCGLTECNRTRSLKLGLNDNTNYADPVNINTLRQPYLYLGFLSTADAQNNNVQGLKVSTHSLIVVPTQTRLLVYVVLTDWMHDCSRCCL